MRPNHSLPILHKSSATLSRLEIYFQMRTCPPCTSSRLHSIPPGAPLSAGKFFHVKDLQFPNCERLVLPLITGQLRLKDAIAGSKRALTLFKLSKLPSPSLQKCDERDGNRRDLSSHRGLIQLSRRRLLAQCLSADALASIRPCFVPIFVHSFLCILKLSPVISFRLQHFLRGTSCRVTRVVI